MELTKEEVLWETYTDKHKGTNGYAHFDPRVDFASKKVQDHIMDQDWVAKHAFWPFLHFEQCFKKAKRVNGKITTKCKNRQLFYSSHIDSCIYRRYAFLLNQLYNRFTEDNGLQEVSIAYRDNLKKPPCHFAAKAFGKIRKMQDCFIMIGDFTEFFDHLNHAYLKERLLELLHCEKLPDDYYAVFRSITKFAYCELEDILNLKNVPNRGDSTLKKFNKQYNIANKEELKVIRKLIKCNPHPYGVPQGAAISDVFANIYMMDFDKVVHQYVSTLGGTYMRYSDDTIIILPLGNGKTTSEYTLDIKRLIARYAEYVELQDEKTKLFEYHKGEIVPISKGEPCFIDYLGLRLTNSHIGLRPRSLTKYYYRMHRKAETIRKRRYKILIGHISNNKNSYHNIYSCYGKSKDPDKSTFINYIELVDKKLRELNVEPYGLDKDPEVKPLLHMGWKKKIRKAITLRGRKP